jgi:hypothetical protein
LSFDDLDKLGRGAVGFGDVGERSTAAEGR